MEFIDEEIENYTIAHTNKEPKLLAELNRETWATVMNPRMLSGHLQGRILSMFSKLIKPKRIIEVGTYTGYSSLCLAEGLTKNGRLHTIDINEEYSSISKKYFNLSKHKQKIHQHIGNAINIIPKIEDNFQLAFIDADKENYCSYFDLIAEKIDLYGYIIADNVLWSGKVTELEKDKETKALDAYNKKVSSNKKFETLLLPVRDGLMISRKIG